VRTARGVVECGNELSGAVDGGIFEQRIGEVVETAAFMLVGAVTDGAVGTRRLMALEAQPRVKGTNEGVAQMVVVDWVGVGLLILVRSGISSGLRSVRVRSRVTMDRRCI
jgi:hypothetical protein